MSQEFLARTEHATASRSIVNKVADNNLVCISPFDYQNRRLQNAKPRSNHSHEPAILRIHIEIDRISYNYNTVSVTIREESSGPVRSGKW